MRIVWWVGNASGSRVAAALCACTGAAPSRRLNTHMEATKRCLSAIWTSGGGIVGQSGNDLRVATPRDAGLPATQAGRQPRSCRRIQRSTQTRALLPRPLHGSSPPRCLAIRSDRQPIPVLHGALLGRRSRRQEQRLAGPAPLRSPPSDPASLSTEATQQVIQYFLRAVAARLRPLGTFHRPRAAAASGCCLRRSNSVDTCPDSSRRREQPWISS